MVTDMTSGRTFSVLLKFSLPMLLSVAFQQLYNIVDSVIAGNFVSDMVLGAIGASYPMWSRTLRRWSVTSLEEGSIWRPASGWLSSEISRA